MRKVMLDVDGCIGDFYQSFATFLNDHYGTTLDLTHEPSGYNFDSWGGGVDQVDVDEATTAWIMSGGYRSLPIYPGAKAFYDVLIGQYDVWVVTARLGTFGHITPEVASQVQSDTLGWFSDHGLTLLHPVTYEHQKIEFCQQHGVWVLIEDKLQTAIDASKANLDTILIDRYWNQSPPRYRVLRAKDYNEALSLLNTVTSR